MKIVLGATLFALGLFVWLLILGVYNDERARASEQRWVRVTYYDLQGLMYNGEWVHEGSAACSWNLELGTTIRFRDGREVVCKDRGHLGSIGWVDVWSPGGVPYDTWEVVEIW